MRSLSVRLLFSLFALIAVPVMAHDVTISGTNAFASLDGSSSDHDGSVNGVFTVSDGNLVVNGTVNCNDDTGASNNACSMAFAVSGNMSVNAGGALYAENRTGSGIGGAITLTVGGNLALSGNAIVSTASKSSSGSTGGAITANVTSNIAVGAGSTIDSGSANARGGAIVLVSAASVTVDGNVLSGPSRTLLATRLSGGAALDGGTSNTIGGVITIGSSTFVEPAVVIGSTANIISQGADGGAGPVTIDGCGITVRGLVAALSRKDGAARVSIRSGKDVLVDGRDLGGSGTRMGRIRADAPTGTAANKGVDIFAAETIDLFGAPAAGSLYLITSLPGLHDSKSYGGVIRITSLGDAVNGSGKLIDDGHSASGDTGGSVQIAAKGDVNLDTAAIRAHGDFNTNNNNRGGGSIAIRSHSGNIVWTNGLGEVRPVGSTSGLAPADQGSIVLTACGTINTTGTSFPVEGVATSPLPETHTGVCSPAAPSLPVGVPPLVTCNTPPVANDASASTNEDTTVTITLTGSDADGDSLTFTIVSGPANGSLGPVISTGPTSATVDYTPNLNYNGGDSFVFRANDGNGGTDDATATITIAPVNDAPSFLAGPSVTSLEDSGPQTFANWATSISAGPADESGQTVTFTVTNSNNALFAVQPALASNGTLIYTPAANASGSATITITAQDNGGTANGGIDTSAPQTSSITITAVNDEPSFTGGGDVTVNEDSGAYSAAWASAISAGAGEGGQSLTFVVSNDNNALFASQPAISASGVLTFTPSANANGSATVTVYLQDDGGTANGGDDTSSTVTFTITVNAVNDAPSFTGGGDVTVLEDSGAYSAAWATAISAGPANESGQTVSFNVSNSNNALFAVQPSIDPSGNLTLTLSANTSGSATVTVTLSDNGGTANGGVDTSAPQTFTINVGSVNDAPTFTAGGDVTVNEDSGAYSATWATAISAGPNESGQTVTFSATNSNNALFSVQPSINAAGVLTFTPASNAFGSATVTVTAQDNGGTANGGVDTSAPVTFTITVNGINDPPTANNDAWETEGNTELRVDHGSNVTPHVSDTTPSGTGVFHNDADTIEGDPFTITGVVGCADTTAPFVCAVTGGTVTLEANGTFTFEPSAGATSASFQYTITDQPAAGAPASAAGTVTLTIHDMIWYVNGSALPGGNGTSTSPFTNFASLNGGGDVDGAGDYIFVHNSTVNGSIELEASQRLWGEGVGLIIPRNLNGNGFPTTLVAPGTRPNVIASGDAVLVIGVAGVEIAGLNITTPSGNPIEVTSPSGGSAASAAIYSNVLMATGAEGIDINADSAAGTAVSINDTAITSMGTGVDLLATDGTVIFSFTNGSVASPAGGGIVVDGSAADTLIVNGLSNVTISGNTAGNGISITAARFDANAATAAFETVNAGTIAIGAAGDPVGGAGMTLAGASGDLAFGSLSAHGATTGVTIASTGLYTGSTGMRVTSGGGAISAAAGVGLTVTNTTIGSANLAFTSISATGAASGIVLNNTDTVGGLKVLGTGTAGSGGTIQNTTGAGVSLVNTTSPSFSFMSIQNSGTDGINGQNVNGFMLASSTVSDTAGTTTDDGVELDEVSGAVAISNSIITASPHDNLDIVNTTGTASFAITGSTFSNTNAAMGNNGINFTATGNAVVTSFALTGSTLSGNRADGIQVSSEMTSQIQATLIQNNTFSNNNIGADLTQNSTSSHVMEVSSNTFLGHAGQALNVFTGAGSPAGGVLTAKVLNNTVGIAGVVGSGSATGNGMRININGGADATALVDGNVVRQTPFGRGIEIVGRNGNGGLDVTVTNNDVNPQDTSGFPLSAIFIQSNCVSVCNTVRTDVRNNIVPAGATAELLPTHLALLRTGLSTLQLVDTPPASASCTAQLISTNTGSASASSACTLIPGPISTP